MTHLYERLQNREEKVSVIGLGYVGLPLAAALSEKVDTIGFDVSEDKVQTYLDGFDPTKEVGDAGIRACTVDFTNDETRLREAKFHIVAVPTPISKDNKPDLAYIIAASKLLGQNLTPGSVVVYESTVYPGATEETCIPILEAESGLVCGIDFKIGYSPERINPGDKVHRLETIVKIVSGMDEESLDIIAQVYELIIAAGVHRVSSIKVAEAAKVVENSQRDVNIAFMNELAMVFDRMGIDTDEVVQAMNTKWNALGFYPGLVGGHCIGVDPHYFIYEAEKLGYNSQLIAAGRKINEGMSEFVCDAIIKQLVLANKVVKQAKVAILGLTFKEDCPDIRNSKIVDMVEHLRTYGIEPLIVDPEADPEEVKREFGIDLVSLEDLHDADCVVLAVAHKAYKELELAKLEGLFGDYPNDERVIIDVRSILDKTEVEEQGYRYWRI